MPGQTTALRLMLFLLALAALAAATVLQAMHSDATPAWSVLGLVVGGLVGVHVPAGVKPTAAVLLPPGAKVEEIL